MLVCVSVRVQGRVIVVNAALVHLLVQAIVRGFQGGAHLLQARGFRARRERIQIGYRALDLFQNRSCIGTEGLHKRWDLIEQGRDLRGALLDK